MTEQENRIYLHDLLDQLNTEELQEKYLQEVTEKFQKIHPVDFHTHIDKYIKNVSAMIPNSIMESYKNNKGFHISYDKKGHFKEYVIDLDDDNWNHLHISLDYLTFTIMFKQEDMEGVDLVNEKTLDFLNECIADAKQPGEIIDYMGLLKTEHYDAAKFTKIYEELTNFMIKQKIKDNNLIVQTCPFCGEKIVTTVTFGSGIYMCPKCNPEHDFSRKITFDYMSQEIIEKNQEENYEILKNYILERNL